MGNEVMVHHLLEKGANIHLADKDGWTPLHKAACWGHKNVVKLLSEKRALLNNRGSKGETALNFVANYGSIKDMDHNRVAEEDKCMHNALLDGWDAFNQCEKCDKFTIHAKWASKVSPIVKKFWDAVRSGTASDVKEALSSGVVDVNCKSDIGNSTPLTEAAWKGHTNVVKVLLDEGALANEAERYDRTPLIVAATLGNEDMARLLLDNGAKTNLADKDGWNPLHKAALRGHVNIIKLLLDEGANPNMRNRDGDTPLIIATNRGRRDMEKLLLERGAEADRKYEDVKERLARLHQEKCEKFHGWIGEVNMEIIPKYGCQRCSFFSTDKSVMATHFREVHIGYKCDRELQRPSMGKKRKHMAGRFEKPNTDGTTRAKRMRQNRDQPIKDISGSSKLPEYSYSHEYSVFYRICPNLEAETEIITDADEAVGDEEDERKTKKRSIIGGVLGSAAKTTLRRSK